LYLVIELGGVVDGIAGVSVGPFCSAVLQRKKKESLPSILPSNIEKRGRKPGKKAAESLMQYVSCGSLLLFCGLYYILPKACVVAVACSLYSVCLCHWRPRGDSARTAPCPYGRLPPPHRCGIALRVVPRVGESVRAFVACCRYASRW
jgi:hypothetical protein